MKQNDLYSINTLRSLRTKFGYTQEEAAKLLGVSQVTLRSWEKNADSISYSMMVKLEDLYKTPKDNIFFGNESALSEMLRKGEM